MFVQSYNGHCDLDPKQRLVWVLELEAAAVAGVQVLLDLGCSFLPFFELCLNCGPWTVPSGLVQRKHVRIHAVSTWMKETNGLLLGPPTSLNYGFNLFVVFF